MALDESHEQEGRASCVVQRGDVGERELVIRISCPDMRTVAMLSMALVIE